MILQSEMDRKRYLAGQVREHQRALNEAIIDLASSAGAAVKFDTRVLEIERPGQAAPQIEIGIALEI